MQTACSHSLVPFIMCTCDEHTPATKRAKCWAITVIVLGVIQILGSLGNLAQAATATGNALASSGISLIAAILVVVSGSIAVRVLIQSNILWCTRFSLCLRDDAPPYVLCRHAVCPTCPKRGSKPNQPRRH